MDLGATGSLKAVEPLIPSLEDPGPKVVMSVISSLARLGDVRAPGPLQLLFRHRDKNISDEARKALKKIYGRKL